MPQAIKSFAVNTSSAIVIYTVPASTTAKVNISYLNVIANSILNIGPRSMSAIGTGIVSINPSLAPSSGTSNVAADNSLTIYLTAGQTINTTGSTASVIAQIVVIEEAS